MFRTVFILFADVSLVAFVVPMIARNDAGVVIGVLCFFPTAVDLGSILSPTSLYALK